MSLITLSVVSHGQGSLIKQLLDDLSLLPKQDFKVLITLNLPEDASVLHGFPFPVQIINNSQPKGFGANHNAAFLQSTSKFFAVVNPDIRIPSLDFEELVSPFANVKVAAVGPIVLSNCGETEDSARRFPTLFRLAKRVIFRMRKPDYPIDSESLVVDWVAGMFVVFRRDVFEHIGGFDDRRFFMYFEDVDICRRIKNQGLQVFLHKKESVIHMAQRASHRNLKHMRWHVVSAFRYLTGF